MIIQSIKRPWVKAVKQGNRYAPDPFYQSSEWKRIRKAFLTAHPYCSDPECSTALHRAEMVDHILRIKAGGSRTEWSNLQGLCNKAHARKSARESNERHGK